MTDPRPFTQGEPLRVAIAGCHRMVARTPGSHNFAADFAAVPEARVVAAFDLGAETRDAFRQTWQDVWPDVAVYDDYARMLAEAQPDVVCLSTRQTTHAAQLEQAVAAGVRGILCDKPLATSLAEMDRMLAACEAGGVPLAFALQRRWEPHYLAVRRAIAEGAVGTVMGVLGYGLPNVINHGPHWYDAMLALAGDPEPVWVSGLVDDVSAEPADSRRRMDPNGRGQVGLQGAGVAEGAVGYVTPAGGPGLTFEVLGSSGRLLVTDDGRGAYVWSGSPTGNTAGAPRALDLPPREGHPAGPAMVRDLVRAVRDGGATACDAPHARRATEIGFALHLSSAARGARVDLPAAARSLRIPSLPWGNGA